MNKKYVKATLVAVVALVGGINVFNAQKSVILSDTVLANVEALAQTESDGICRTNIDYSAICNYYDIWDPCPCGF